MKATIEMTCDQIDHIICEDLKLAYEMNRHPNKIDCSDDVLEPDQRLLDAIEVVLQYYMAPGEFRYWKQALND